VKEKSSAPKRKLHLFIVIGLASSLLSFISTPVSAVPPLTCANGGPCQPGDIGPGGGLIFYVSSTPFKCGPNHADDCTYLEVAPKSWSGGTPDAEYYWNLNEYEVNGISRDASPNMGADQFGLGLKNSNLMAAADPSAGNAGVAARGYVSPSKSDWYLPTIAELGILCQYAHGQTPIAGSECNYAQNLNTGVPDEYQFLATSYQSSSQSFNQGEDSRRNAQWHQNFVLEADGNSAQQSTYFYSGTRFATRPIRAFATAVTIEDQEVACDAGGSFKILNAGVFCTKKMGG
jgi:hypothetical protein